MKQVPLLLPALVGYLSYLTMTLLRHLYPTICGRNWVILAFLGWPGNHGLVEMGKVADLSGDLDLNWSIFSGRMAINGSHVIKNIIPLCSSVGPKDWQFQHSWFYMGIY